MKKKVLSILLTAVLAFSAVGCGGNTNTGSTNESTESTGAGADQTDADDKNEAEGNQAGTSPGVGDCVWK